MSSKPALFPPACSGTEVHHVSQVCQFYTYCTKNYEMFKEHGENRVVLDEDQVAKNTVLEKNMKRQGYLPIAAITVARQAGDPQLLVVDGHNRLAIAKKLGLPVWFTVFPEGMTITPLAYSVAQRQWSKSDKAKAYAGTLEDYAEVVAYVKSTGIPEAASFNLYRGEVASNSNGREAWAAGKYVIRDRVMPARIAFAVKVADQPYAHKAQFVTALSKVYVHSVEVFEELVVLLSKHRMRLKPMATNEQYLELFEKEIYNHARRGGARPFKTEIDNTMAQRQRNFGRETT